VEIEVGFVVTWSTSTLVGWLLSRSVSVVADGRRLFPKGSVAAATLQQPTSFEGARGRACNTIQPQARPTIRLLICCRIPPASSSKSSPTAISPPVSSQCPIGPPPADTRARHACTLQTRFPVPTTLRDSSPALTKHVIRIKEHATTCSGTFTGQERNTRSAEQPAQPVDSYKRDKASGCAYKQHKRRLCHGLGTQQTGYNRCVTPGADAKHTAWTRSTVQSAQTQHGA
jgi:hypothetical protein